MLLDKRTEVAVPLFGTSTTTVFLWPVLATGATALVLESSTADWDRRSSRPMVVLDGVTVLATIALSALGPVLLRPQGWRPALAIFLTLQALTVVAATVLGDWAWMLAVGLGSLTVVNSEFVTRTIVSVTGEHWVAFTAASGLVLVLSRILPTVDSETVYVTDACRLPAGPRSPVTKGETRPSMSWPGLVSPEGDWPPEGGSMIVTHPRFSGKRRAGISRMPRPPVEPGPSATAVGWQAGDVFRPARADEAVALRDLEKAANLVALAHVFPPQTHPYPDQLVLDRWRELLADPAMTTLVSEDEQGLTAFAAFDETTLLHLAVRPDHWGTGLAAAAMDCVPRPASGASRRTTGRAASTNAWGGGPPARRSRRPSSRFRCCSSTSGPRPSAAASAARRRGG